MGSRETSALPLTTQKNLSWGFDHNKRLSEITSFDLSIGQGKLLVTKHLFSLQRPFEAPKTPYLIPCSAYLIYSFFLSIFKPLMHVRSLTLACLCGSRTYICFKFGYFLVNQAHVYLIIRPAKNLTVEERFFLPQCSLNIFGRNTTKLIRSFSMQYQGVCDVCFITGEVNFGHFIKIIQCVVLTFKHTSLLSFLAE